MTRRLQLVIRGEVQGVGFRFSLVQQAKLLSLVGWVQNHADGTVHVLAEGDAQRLQEFLDWCYTGVRSARVTRITAEWGLPSDTFHEFEIRR